MPSASSGGQVHGEQLILTMPMPMPMRCDAMRCKSQASFIELSEELKLELEPEPEEPDELLMLLLIVPQPQQQQQQLESLEFPRPDKRVLAKFCHSVSRGITYLCCGLVVNQGTYAVPGLTMPQSHDADAARMMELLLQPRMRTTMTMTSCPGSFGN
ncbi:hypothetical protein M5D96_006503 [Drosophila gunungcola]|uniref:Uncharacterized protein n=1 Tax=Drosophila gunungcola TaxID=103775 RepID=A0A9P9YPL2_9MUSC|nr:hypothetical protein M5D96_006503 [Drosophila gunungcola]